MKSCFMFGHGDAPDEIMPKLEQAIEKGYTVYGVTDFYVGNRGRFDHLAAAAVRKVKQRHPEVRLYLLLAYHPAERAADLWGGFDGSYYPPLESTPRQYAIVKANRYMVHTSDFLICYVKHPGNTRELLQYAEKRKKEGIPIENIAQT